MDDRFIQLQNLIVKLMRKFKVPGLAISILHKGERVYEKGYGARNLEENLPMTKDSLIGIGSISKSFTALLILKMQEKGLLNIEDPVNKYLEMEPFLSHPDIKLIHLLSHSSGIPSVDGQWLPVAITFGDYQRIYPVTSLEDYLYHLSQTKDEIFFDPKEKFFYNNDMYALLGLILEKINGETFENILKGELLIPLEMSRTTVKREVLEKDPKKDYIRGYLHKGTPEKLVFEHPKLPFDEFLQAPGGIYSSMHEMLNYAEFLLNDGVFKGNRIVDSESIKLLWTPQIDSPYGYGKDPKYCLGWVREEEFHGYTLIHHSGGLGVSTSFLGLIPELNLAVSVSENDDAGICGLIGVSALLLMAEKNPQEVLKRLKLVEISEEIVGTYQSSLGLYKLETNFKNLSIQIKVESDDGTFTFPLIIKNYDDLIFEIFSTIPYPLQKVQFHRNLKTGKVEYVTYDRYLYHKK
ncbi:MAG: serine hydrolase domain-containing protein [Candidatus Thorarchaeota archaeon]